MCLKNLIAYRERLTTFNCAAIALVYVILLIDNMLLTAVGKFYKSNYSNMGFLCFYATHSPLKKSIQTESGREINKRKKYFLKV